MATTINTSNKNTVKLLDILKIIFENNKTNTISEETLLSLYYIFDQTIFASLELIDKELITKYVFQPSNRYFYVVEGRKGAKYMCLIQGDYCSCPSFNFSVLLKSDSVYCKHQISSILAEIISNVKVIEFDDSEYQSQILSIESLSFKTPTHKFQQK
ncbi:hypothetical protein DDB_G0268092 [Dictyostelium discoideum AX4]|uniref:Zinc finger SWIM domain-containing protein 7 homolog n=1 Tax=Dictyostelium discoideum TaxID=44689 RepID=ZSWM7_DICDI|nr:hypothetical protein DDB_G0268092 [Dictyostelium discoideum AX4]Q55FI7.1 RecName: Full=Zinc finger SWIM domain-containing protein 7 homolog [Dictyostelium discoideum]EAL73499.1 hypothetical protein DDB_G0268092 [Dictyostelium discoideum AX4]|eukprot:XP_647546.1 hypothetical protein DDB_G0268092 [Dictyostelium discoideum AX4]